MKDEKKVKATEEETKKEIQTEEEGVQLTEEKLSSVAAGWPWDPCPEYIQPSIRLKQLSESPLYKIWHLQLLGRTMDINPVLPFLCEI